MYLIDLSTCLVLEDKEKNVKLYVMPLCGSRKHKDSIPKNTEKNTILALLATSISC